MIRFSANLGFLWPDLPLLERIAAAGEAGFRAVELHWPFEIEAERVAAACSDAGVQLLGLNTPVGDASRGEFGLGALRGREAEYEAAFRKALAYSTETGAAAIHAMAGLAAADAISRATFIQNLGWSAREAAAHGTTVLIEPINHIDKPGYFLGSTDQAAEIISEVNQPNLKILFDCYHVAMQGEVVMAQFEKHLPLIGHVQIAAVPSRAEPDEGRLDYRSVLGCIDRLPYSGWIGCEYRPRAGTVEGLRWQLMWPN